MRDLHFKANGQTLQKAGSFEGLVAGSRGYLRAVFAFSAAWDGCVKAASFWLGDRETAVLLEDDACMIPEEICREHAFHVSVKGARCGYAIGTDKAAVYQK